jgi:hypothetical protein
VNSQACEWLGAATSSSPALEGHPGGCTACDAWQCHQALLFCVLSPPPPHTVLVAGAIEDRGV